MHRGSKQFGKQSVDYDDTEFLQKMFSNVDSDIRNLAKNNKASVISINQKDGQALESFRKNQNDVNQSTDTRLQDFSPVIKQELKNQLAENNSNEETALLEDGGAVYKNQDPMVTYTGMGRDNPLQDEDILKIDRLQLINASARYQLLSANQ